MQPPSSTKVAIASASKAHNDPPTRVGAKVDDGELAAQALAGKPWAQREVWHRYASMVYGLLR